jgi:predicted esterase
MSRLILLLLFATSALGQLTENIVSRTDPTQTYTLYRPTTYDAAKKHPLLLVFDPRGRGTTAAGIFRDAAEEYGWIVISSNQTRSDDPAAPNDRAVRALLAETNVYAVDPKRIYAAGFSGTAILAWGVGISTHRLAGVIGVGGRLESAVPPAKFNFAHYGFAGERDFNNREMRRIDGELEGVVPHRFQAFDGEHRWIPPALAREALGWFEVLAGNERVRAKVLAEDVAAAEKLTGLAALRRWQAIRRTYGGFEDRIAKLDAARDLARELADEQKWDEWEAQYVSDVFFRLGPLLGPIRKNPNTADLERVFRLKDLRRRAKRAGAEGAAAKRLLTAVQAQTGYYLPLEFEARNEPAMAATLRRVAESLAPHSQ